MTRRNITIATLAFLAGFSLASILVIHNRGTAERVYRAIMADSR